MRVFEYFTYNLNQIRFKETKDFFDNLLKTLDLQYSGVAFNFENDDNGDICDKIIKKFPNLKEYKQYGSFAGSESYIFSSFSIKENSEIITYVNKEHQDDFSALVRKIPNPINFGFMGVALDNVNWYGEKTQTPVFYSRVGKCDIYSNKFHCYYSNSIRLFKEFDFGNKLNLVEIMIERTIEKDDLGPYPEKFNQLLEKLGKPKYNGLECVFSDDEKERWAVASQKIEKEFEERNRPLLNANAVSYTQEYLNDFLTCVSGFSPKTAFAQYAKNNGYKKCFYKNGCYRYKKVNSNNHTFIVEFMNISFSLFFDASVSVKGHNFSQTLYSVPRETIRDITCAEAYAEKVFEIAAEMEKEYTQKLLDGFGKTPKWYADMVY